jgi:lysine biosynthesis protein LysW
MMETSVCIDCGVEIGLNRPREGDRLGCPNCGAGLEVVGVAPLEFDWAHDETEDTEQEYGEEWTEEELRVV